MKKSKNKVELQDLVIDKVETIEVHIKNESPIKYNIGDVVEVNKVYVKANDTAYKQKHLTDCYIIKINEDDLNFYQLSTGGYANNESIVKKVGEKNF